MSRETLGSFFLDCAAHHPHRPLVRRIEGVRSYADLAVSVASTVEHLREGGLKRGDHVPCFLEDQVPNLTFELACALSGVIAVPLSSLFSLDYFVDGIVDQVGARAVLTTTQNAPALAGRGLCVFAFPEAHSHAAAAPVAGVVPLVDRVMTWEQAIENLRAASAGISGDDVFVVQPTSGSTGKPKLVVRRHRAFTRYAEFVGDQLEMPDPEAEISFLTTATLTHAFGLHMLATALKKAATLCVSSGLDTAASLAEIRALDPVVLPILPHMQRALMRQYERDDPGGARIFGPSARYVCSAGGVADPELLGRIRRTGVEIIEFYGSSEASLVAVTPCGDWRPGWSGLIVPDALVRVTGDGELAVRSPGVMPGYFGDAAATAAVFDADGYYLTGDLGEVDDDGRLRILGRKRDVFNTPEGSNIYPGRIEQQIESLPRVEAAVLVGDQRPFMVALLAVPEPPTTGNGAAFVDPVACPELYDELGNALMGINAPLERVEKVIRFVVLSRPFASEAYRVVGPGKVRRDRSAINSLYGDIISYLYRETRLPDPSFVPGTERRLRPAERY